MSETPYEHYAVDGGVPIKAWVKGVPFGANAHQQLINTARLPIVKHWVAAMPDVHWGLGATIGSVVPTVNAIIPAAVGVDIGCGMMAAQTTLSASDLPDNLAELRSSIERAVPHGRTGGGRQREDHGSWRDLPESTEALWKKLEGTYHQIVAKHPALSGGNTGNHLGTLGTGNHFIEVCLDEVDRVWVMLHSGSRGIGNKIGSYFIQLAREEMQRLDVHLPDRDLAYLQEGTQHFDDYVQAVEWAQNFAAQNRQLMMENILSTMGRTRGIPPFTTLGTVVNCHHNYVMREVHFGSEVYITRKGAVRARQGDMGIIPGSMGARSYIVRGKGNPESFHSCSHGAGRLMSRTEAKKRFTLADHRQATQGIECRQDKEVIDETPMAYKDIDVVMAAQKDLVEVVHTLKQVICIKG